MSSWALSAPGVQKVQNGVENEPNSTIFHSTIVTLFRLRFGLFGTLAERLQEHIFALFLPLWARRAQITPVAGKSLCKLRRQKHAFSSPTPSTSALMGFGEGQEGEGWQFMKTWWGFLSGV